MKPWLRANPEYIPNGYHPDDKNSRTVFGALKREGWTWKESGNEIHLIPPDPSTRSVIVRPTLDQTSEGNDELSFGFESHLRDFIANNLSSLPVKGRVLRLYDDSDGRKGVEYPTEVGRIDILAIDSAGNFVVFELKLDRGPDKAIGQLLRYMGWVARNLAKDRQTTGVIAAKDIDKEARYAVSVIPNVTLLEYKVSFSFEEVVGVE